MVARPVPSVQVRGQGSTDSYRSSSGVVTARILFRGAAAKSGLPQLPLPSALGSARRGPGNSALSHGLEQDDGRRSRNVKTPDVTCHGNGRHEIAPFAHQSPETVAFGTHDQRGRDG